MALDFRISLPAALSARVDTWLAAPAPGLALEVAAGRVVGARTPGRKDAATPRLRCALRPLPAEAVVPSARQANLSDPAALTSEIQAVLARLDGAGMEAALLVPDLTARVSILDFDALPKNRAELDGLVRFRLRKTLPFDADQAALCCQLLTAPKGQKKNEGPHRVMVALADRARLDEYENCVEAAGALPVLTLPSGLACLAAHPALENGTLLVRAEQGSLTTAFCWGGELEFFRVVETDGVPGFEDAFASVAYFHECCERRGFDGAAAGGENAVPILFTAGLAAAAVERLREEAPWAQIREAEIRSENAGESGAAQLLAVTGALRGKFL